MICTLKGTGYHWFKIVIRSPDHNNWNLGKKIPQFQDLACFHFKQIPDFHPPRPVISKKTNYPGVKNAG
jgi:hypothetical protein